MKVTAYIRHTQVDKAGSRPRLSPDLAPENIIGCVSKDRWKQASMISENQTKSRAPCTTAMTYKVVLKEEELGFPLGIYSQEERKSNQMKAHYRETNHNRTKETSTSPRSQLWSFYENKLKN